MKESDFGYHKHHHHKPHKKADELFIECVIVCKDYADFLAWTLPFNKQQFSNLVVVTAPSDKRTIKLCTHYNVQCVETDAFNDGGSKFNKAAAINVGLSKLKRTGYIVHLDADILLPPRAKEFIERSCPRPEFIYGIDRMDCPSFTAFAKYLSNPELQFVKNAFIQAHVFRIGHRLVTDAGYIPIGFFQLWHPEGSGIYEYCTERDKYNDHNDAVHAKQWPRNKRGFIPEVVAIHIQSDDARHGSNWQGRVSSPFGIDN